MKTKSLMKLWRCAGTTLLMFTLLACAGGCCARRQASYPICNENIEHRVPVITCQPGDSTASPGQAAAFEVDAAGHRLTYQWYFLGGTNNEFEAVEGQDRPRLMIERVKKEDYGYYMCVIGSECEKDGPIVTQTRWAYLAGVVQTNAGGVFVPTQGPVGSSSTTKVCGETVSGKWVAFPGSQTPEAGKTGFRGYLYNITTSQEVANANYVLQMWVSSVNKPCCTPDPNMPPWVVGTVSSQYSYVFIAHFKKGKAPPSGNIIELRGAWTP